MQVVHHTGINDARHGVAPTQLLYPLRVLQHRHLNQHKKSGNSILKRILYNTFHRAGSKWAPELHQWWLPFSFSFHFPSPSMLSEYSVILQWLSSKGTLVLEMCIKCQQHVTPSYRIKGVFKCDQKDQVPWQLVIAYQNLLVIAILALLMAFWKASVVNSPTLKPYCLGDRLLTSQTQRALLIS